MSNEFEFPPPAPGNLQPPAPGNLQPPNRQDLPPPAVGAGVGSPLDAVPGFFDQPLGASVVPASPGIRLWGAILEGILFCVTLGFGWIIWSVFAWQKGKTPAKAVIGLTVVNSRTNQTASFGQMVMREVLLKYALSWVTSGLTLFFGGALVLAPKRQALWDLIGSTTVVSR